MLRWGESPTGRTVTFLLPDDTPQHPFRGLKCGPAHGQRLALSVALIHDDETTTAHAPAPQPSDKPASGANGNGADRRSFKELPRSQQAGILCGDVVFEKFLRDRRGEKVVLDDNGQIDAAATLRRICCIDSRRDLDTGNAAAAIFDKLRDDYRFWRDNP